MTEFVPFPKISRFSREIIITEKLDGTNAQIAIVANDNPPSIVPAVSIAYIEQHFILAGSRSRWLSTGKTNDNHGFAAWVSDNAPALVKLGPGRHFGEWWGKGIQRGYGLDHKRFSLFNVTRWSGLDRGGAPACCSTVPILYQGAMDSDEVENSLEILRAFGSLAAPGFKSPEGVVIFHAAANVLFKKTLEKDDEPKSLQEVA